MTETAPPDLLRLAAEIVSAHVSNNSLTPDARSCSSPARESAFGRSGDRLT